MDSVVILDTEKPVGFIDTDPDRPLDAPSLLAGLQKMADLINDTQWTAAQRAAFNGMKAIVFFLGSVQVGAYELKRPGCDEANAVFYWEVGEFLANTDPCVRANIFFHDCWHVVQYKADGFAQDLDERVAREVDALERQIEAAQAMNCYAGDIKFLTDFAADPQAIRDRLAFGVSTMHHA
ncbi:MAG TPA: hypothetical protein VGC92_07590 [Phenylobacterium sp.]|jgi:hypothetical protein